jgi:hypothetical protein
MDYIRSSNSGYFSFNQTIVPNRWQGECDCFVGPFSSKHVAEHYVSAVVDFGQFESISRRVFAKGDSWFVEVQEV